MSYSDQNIIQLISYKLDWAIYYEEVGGAQLVLRRDIYGRCERMIIFEVRDTGREFIPVQVFEAEWLRGGGDIASLLTKPSPLFWRYLE